jgi:hypothetical protein
VRFQEFAPTLRAKFFEKSDCWGTILSPAFTDLVVLDFEYEIARRYQASQCVAGEEVVDEERGHGTTMKNGMAVVFSFFFSFSFSLV